MDRDDIYYEALKSRDHRFDGKFFVGVKTTGIYCRPICPARPKRENVTFFDTSHAAEKAGYRPCLRCRPEAAPLSSAWIGTSAVVRRAMRTLGMKDPLLFNEDDFAESFGVSARHLRRLFVEEIGKTPKQLAFENRLNTARKLIVETSLPFSDVAFASGFRSIRRFNDAFKDRFKKSPSEIRRTPLLASRGISISLPYRPPLDFDSLMRTYTSHRVGRLESFVNGKMRRIIEQDGKVGTVTIANDASASRLLIEIDFPDPSVIHVVLSKARALFDLDSDPVLVANSLETDVKTQSILRKFPGIRLPSGWDPFEIAIATILGQLVSVDRGRELTNRLIDLLGEDSGLQDGEHPIRFFPTPEKIANADLALLPTTGARKETLKAFASAVHRGEISLEPTQDVEEFAQKVKAIRGIGNWTANYIALRALRNTDAFPDTDLILARALKIHSPEKIEKMSPWRGYAAALYWREYAGILKKEKKMEKGER